jgi:peptidoglycan hydrolase-like protein with peptidoglycan-binding domain
MKTFKHIAISVLFAATLATPALAQTYPVYSGYGQQEFCPALSYNLYIGLSDYQTGGQVSQLQQFLSTRYAQPVTGYFGSITRANVALFQQQNGVYPVTGGVGPLTRGAIARACQGGGVPTPGGVSIINVAGPNSLQVGQSGTWNITTSAQNGYVSLSVRWGDESIYPYAAPASQANGYLNQQNSFSHAYYQAGTYTITFTATDSYGRVSSATASVVVGNGCAYYGCTTNAPVITSISPVQGPVGTQLTIYGSGFTGSNVVHFGTGGAMQVPSYNNGTLINFTIPSSVSPCDVIQTFAVCQQLAQQVTPGAYSVSVSNSNGTSAAQTFTVTGSNCNWWTNCQGSITVTSPTGGTYTRGNQLPISWSGASGGYSSVSTILDLYTSGGNKIGTIAIQSGASGTYTWSIPPFPNNRFCTMQYPNGLCGTNIADGQYYIKATLVQGSGFDNGATISSSNSGTFTINGGTQGGSSVNAFPQSGQAPLMVTFSLSNYNGQYAVDFGDGTSASLLQEPVSHTYSLRGTYTAHFTSDYACFHTTPQCRIATQDLGSVTITVF